MPVFCVFYKNDYDIFLCCKNCKNEYTKPYTSNSIQKTVYGLSRVSGIISGASV